MLSKQLKAGSHLSQGSKRALQARFSVAPMLDWTDRHCRYFHRLLAPSALLYTEMITTGAIIHAPYDLLEYHESEHPVALQLGGSSPTELAHCTKLAVERGYDEVNLNVGCPSDRVQNGKFGACLMAEPTLVKDCIQAMQDAAPDTLISVKTRLGIDEQDSYEFLCELLEPLAAIGCQRVVLHARKAWLKGLSPKENRDIPPLDYDRVYLVKQEFPQFNLHINGGIQSIKAMQTHLEQVDGVMIGRAAYQNPWLLQAMEQAFGIGAHNGSLLVQDRAAVVEQLIPYLETHLQQGGRFWHVVRHILGLYQGEPGARQWRRYLSEQGPTADSAEVLVDALHIVQHQAELIQQRKINYLQAQQL